MQWETTAVGERQQGESENLRGSMRKSCGWTIVDEKTAVVTACPFYGHLMVIMGRQLAGVLHPD